MAGKLEKICTAFPLTTFLTKILRGYPLEFFPPKILWHIPSWTQTNGKFWFQLFVFLIKIRFWIWWTFVLVQYGIFHDDISLNCKPKDNEQLETYLQKWEEQVKNLYNKEVSAQHREGENISKPLYLRKFI